MLRQAANAPAEEELTQAVRRVHEHYGTDLNSFFRDILEQIRRNRESERSQHEPASSDDQTAA
jgi:CHASE3 domain sensor protein